VSGQQHTPAVLYLREIYWSLGGPQGRSGEVRKISPPPGFGPRTAQTVVSRHTDRATRPTSSTYDRKENSGFSSLVTNDVKNTTDRVLSVSWYTKSLKMNNAATVAAQLVKCIRSKVLNLRQFTEFFSDTDSDSRHVLYYTDISWMSRGRLLKRA
jgi:hypothetical protein